ncbi:hypothetical protein D3C80_1273970 [compost metagenome]
MPELGLFEIALHVEGVDVYQGHQGHPGAGVVADPGLQVGDVTVAGGVHLGSRERPSGLLQIGLGHLIGRLHRLGIEPGLVDRLGGDDGAGQSLATPGLVLRLVEIRFRLGQRRVGVVQGNPVGHGIQAEQGLPLLHQLVVLDPDADYLARHLGGDADQLGPHLAIPGPGALHVVVPQPPERHQRQGADQQGGEVFEGCQG